MCRIQQTAYHTLIIQQGNDGYTPTVQCEQASLLEEVKSFKLNQYGPLLCLAFHVVEEASCMLEGFYFVDM